MVKALLLVQAILALWPDLGIRPPSLTLASLQPSYSRTGTASSSQLAFNTHIPSGIGLFLQHVVLCLSAFVVPFFFFYHSSCEIRILTIDFQGSPHSFFAGWGALSMVPLNSAVFLILAVIGYLQAV